MKDKGPIAPTTLSQIEGVARVQAVAIVNNQWPIVGKTLSHEDEREREMRISLQEQALVYAHKLHHNQHGTLIDPHVADRESIKRLRRQLKQSYAAKMHELDTNQQQQQNSLERSQKVAEDQYQVAQDEHMIKVRAQRPAIKEVSIEETQKVLLQNTIQQFQGFHNQMKILHDQFDAQNKPNSAAAIAARAAQANSASQNGLLKSEFSNAESAPVEIDPAQHEAHLQTLLADFWSKQDTEMEDLVIGTEQDFKNHNDLPLARIKRIMKSDEDVRMISAEAPVLFAKACEMFILELTLRSWCYSEQSKRRTLQKEDIQTAIKKTEIFDFLVDVVYT